MKVVLKESNPAINTAQLEKLREKLGRDIPSELIELLRISNGGAPSLESCLFKYRSGYNSDDVEVDTVQRIFSSDQIAESCYNMGIEMGVCQFVPFATTGLGGALMLGIEKHGVYLMEIGRHEDFSEAPKTRLFKTLSGFFGILSSVNSDYEKMEMCNG